MRTFWRKLKNHILGRTWFLSTDPYLLDHSHKAGETSWVYGYRDRRGILHIAASGHEFSSALSERDDS